MTTHDDDLIPLDLQVKPLADELEEVRAKVKVLKARESELTLELRAMTGGDGAYGPVVIQTPRTLDTEAVARAYPVATHPYLYALEVDPAKVKAHLAEYLLDGFKVDGTPRVSVKR